MNHTIKTTLVTALIAPAAIGLLGVGSAAADTGQQSGATEMWVAQADEDADGAEDAEGADEGADGAEGAEDAEGADGAEDADEGADGAEGAEAE